MLVTFVSELDFLEPCRVYTPERSEVEVDLVVLVWELDVVLLDVCPPSIEARWRCSGVSEVVLTNCFGKRFTSACEFCIPLFFCVFDEVKDGVSTAWMYFEETV